MRFLFVSGLVVGFAYEAGMTWYAAWSPQVQVGNRPHFGPDVILLCGLIGAWWGGLLAAAVGAACQKIRERHRANMTKLMRQIAEEEKEAVQAVWLPPPTSRE